MAADDQLARALGSDWETMRYRQIAGRAIALEQAATLARTIASCVRQDGHGRRRGARALAGVPRLRTVRA